MTKQVAALLVVSAHARSFRFDWRGVSGGLLFGEVQFFIGPQRRRPRKSDQSSRRNSQPLMGKIEAED